MPRDQPQQVRVNAAEDADRIDGQRTFMVSATGLASQALVVSEVDNDPVFSDWAAQAGLSGDDARPEASPFGDGVANLLKFALNLDGSRADCHSMVPVTGTSGLPVLWLEEVAGIAMLRFTHVRRLNSGLTYVVKQSETLEPGAWAPMAGARTTVATDDPAWERVVIEAPYDPVARPRCFFRLEVSEPLPPDP